MFIGKIVLNNFRIFKGEHEFDFSGRKVIVVEGPNGHGKSTIFDAINWGISGKITRYVGSSEHQQFNYIINSEAYLQDANTASVEIHFDSKEELVIKRTINKNGSNKLFINGRQKRLREGQREIVRLLINEKIFNDDNILDTIDLPSFIESTLIISQENLEEFVRGNKPTERYYKLEQILGLTRYGQDFKDYLQILKKEHLMEHTQMISKIDDLVHKKELLNAEYQPKLQQSERNGNKSKSKILKELNAFYGDLQNYSFKSPNNYHYFYDVTIEEYEYLLKNIKLIENKIKKLDFLKFDIEEKQIYISDIMSTQKIRDFNDHIDVISQKKIKRERGLKRAISIIEKLHKITLTNTLLDHKKIEKEKLEISINNNMDKQLTISQNLNMNYDNLTKQIINDYIQKFEINTELLNKLLEKNNIIEYENNLAILMLQAEKLEIEYKKKNKLIDHLQDQIKKIDEQIFEVDNKKKNNLESQINRIIHEVQTHLINSDEKQCLVCGSTFKSKEELKASVNTQLLNSNKLLNKFEIVSNEHKIKKNKLSVDLNVTIKELDICQQELKEIREKITNLKNIIVVMRLNNPINIENIEEVQIEIENAKSYKQNNDIKYKGFLELKKGWEFSDDLKLQIEQIKKEEKLAIKTHKNYMNFIGNQSNLQLKLNKINNYVNTVKQKIQEYDKEVLELRQSIHKVEIKLKQLSEIKNKLEKIINCELTLNGMDILDFINNYISLFKKENFKLRELARGIEGYLNDINLREMESKIKEYDQEYLGLNKKIEQYENLEARLVNLTTYHTQVQSALLNEYLNNLSVSINNYFRQISPHSYFNFINLKAKRNELFILLKDSEIQAEDVEFDNHDSVNASLTLSAAQSTILAMSIFLALNKSQNWSKLNIIGIDDPFQNLDDINAYSFIDVMSNLISVENRQVIISTHDSDFAKLSVRKLNLKSDEYTYIKIQSYTREAIEIQSEQYKLLGM